MKRKKSWLSQALYRLIFRLVRLCYGKMELVGIENLPATDTIIVGNHSQMNGPLVGELLMPKNCYIWCAGQMMHVKEVPHYAFTDFWSQKPTWTHSFYKIFSYLIAPFAGWLFNQARTIAVYRDTRIISTFRETVQALCDGKNILIFPEKDEKHNNILYAFQENFVDVARLYYKKTGKNLTFVPMYIAPRLKKTFFGKGIQFNGEAEISEERSRITTYLSDEITSIARALPPHIVVPYRNIPKKNYLSNQDVEKVPR